MEISKNHCEVCGEEFIPTKKQTARCSKKHFKKCLQCEGEFEVTSQMPKSRVYCGRKCATEANKRKPQQCEVCGEIISNRSRTATTCSKECSLIKKKQTILEKDRKCEWCGEKFNAVSNQKYCEGPHFKNCVVCGKSFKVDPYNPPKTCSLSCRGKLVNNSESNLKRQETSLKNWGANHPTQNKEVYKKIEESIFKKYGVKTALASPQLREKGKETSLERYGNEYYAASEAGRKAREETNLKLYGAKNPFASPIIRDKIQESWLNIYGVKHPMKNPEVVQKVKATNLERYGVENVLMVEEFKLKARETFRNNVSSGKITHPKISLINRNMAQKISDQLELKCEFEIPFGSYQADLLVKNSIGKEILVDLNPTVSHNSLISFACLLQGCKEQPCKIHQPLGKSYHFNRAKTAMENNYTLLQQFDWSTNEELLNLIKGRLSPIANKYSARKLNLQKISKKDTNVFLEKYHIQGATKGDFISYGLYTSENELIAVATFGKSRFNSNYEYEFLRYAVKNECLISGGASRLFKEFLKEYSPKSVISYVDFNHTTRKETFLNSCGFKEIIPTGPALIWYRPFDGKTVKNTALLKLGADRVLSTSYGNAETSGLNNREIMLLEGFLPVFTAGNRVFTWS